MLRVFFDPAATARRAEGKFFWIWPFLLAGAAGLVTQLRLTPLALRVLQTNPPLGFSAADLQPFLDPLREVLHDAAFLSPLLLAAKLFGIACVIVWTSKLMKMPLRFLPMFNLVAACSLIQMLEDFADYFLVRARAGEIHSLGQLQASFGLDLLLPHLASPVLSATFNFFSLFEIWYLAALAIGISYLAGCSRSKGFAAITLVWLPSLAWALLSALL